MSRPFGPPAASVTRIEDLLPADEQTRRDECGREPIHIPGGIQPHGALLAVDSDTWQIVQASTNSGFVLGIDAPDLLGRSLDVVFDGGSLPDLRGAFNDGADLGRNPIFTQVTGRPFDTIVHRVGELVILEFEPAVSLREREFFTALFAAMRRLASIDSVRLLGPAAARELRALTGFDQVMCYRFHPDGHGEVIADAHAEGMDSYLGLHFPASDIPSQARILYLNKPSQLIATSDYAPAALVPADNPHTGAPLDLSGAELRSVSPFHLEFMRNMGQGSSMTLPLAHNGTLRGMITCAHRGPRHVPYVFRRGYELLAHQLLLQLVAQGQTHRLMQQLQTQHVRARLVEQMVANLDVAGGLAGADDVTVLDLVTADGAIMRLHQKFTFVGDTPTGEQTTALLATLAKDPEPEAPMVTESLETDRPDLAALVPSIAGLVALPFGGSGDYLLWFRREVAQSVNWLGEQSSTNRASVLSPRNSFRAWRQTVTGRSVPWNETEVAEAIQLCRDIDHILLRRAEAQLAYMGLHDSLTGLANRNLLLDRVTSAIERADRNGEQVVVLFCDLDGFKRVNDTAGHAAGDAVLVEVAGRLQAALRAGDSVARVGGDEFVIVLEPARRVGTTPDTLAPENGASGADQQVDEPHAGQVAAQIAERVRTELCRPITFLGHEHVISVSTGMALVQPGSRAEDVLRDADAAMYRAKHGGKNRVEVFDDSLRGDITERGRIEHVLRSALASGGAELPHLGVAYQPVIDVASGALAGFEVLARLTDSDSMPIRPRAFIPVAEQNGLISALGEVVLEAALSGLVRWRAAHPALEPATVSVNFSARQAQHSNMPTLVRAALSRHGLQPTDLTLELTETVLLEAGTSTLRQLTELHEYGVGIALDDFGTGYASLRYLAMLPVDTIKVDTSFAAGLGSDPVNTAIVTAVARLAADLGMRCIVEGIETERQLAALPEGVLGQGYLLGRPTTEPQDHWIRATPA